MIYKAPDDAQRSRALYRIKLVCLYPTYFIIKDVFLHDFLVFYYFEFEILEIFASFLI